MQNPVSPYPSNNTPLADTAYALKQYVPIPGENFVIPDVMKFHISSVLHSVSLTLQIYPFAVKIIHSAKNK